MRKAVGGAATARSTVSSKQTVRSAVSVRPAAGAPVRRVAATRPAAKPATRQAPPIALVRPAAPAKARSASAPMALVPPSHSDHPFLGALLARRRELTGNLEETKFDALSKMGRVAEDDQAQMSHEEFISLQRNSMDYTALRQVNAAIERVNTGDYGVCAACDEPISEKRLKAISWAKYCVVCQDRVQADGTLDNAPEEDAVNDSW